MPQPLISIIIPIYKVERWLPRCLDSVCGQTYPHLEIICIDDESPDACGRILDDYAAKDARIKVIHQKNQGLSGARNAGLDIATGEWITGVDSDDYLLPDIYEKAVEHLDKSIDLLFFGTEVVDEKGHPIPGQVQDYFTLPSEGRYSVRPEISRQLSACFWNKIWKRSIIKEHNLRFPQGLLHEDEAFLRLFLPFAEHFYILPHIGYRYMQRPGSIMAQRAQSAVEKHATRFIEIADYLENCYKSINAPAISQEYLISLLWQIYLNYARRAPQVADKIAELASRLSEKSQADDYRVKRMLTPHRTLLHRLFIGYSENYRDIKIGKLSLLREHYSCAVRLKRSIFPQLSFLHREK